MTRKWASCSPLGRLTFAADLLGQPSRFQTAVIVHELLHLAVPNHGPLFRSLMRAHLPGVRHQWMGRARECGISAVKNGIPVLERERSRKPPTVAEPKPAPAKPLTAKKSAKVKAAKK